MAEVVSVKLARTDPMNDFAGYGHRPMGGGWRVSCSWPVRRADHTRDGRTSVVATPDADRLVEVLAGLTTDRDRPPTGM